MITLTPELQDLQQQVRTFIQYKIIPYENDPRMGEHGPSDELRAELIQHAREAQLLTPHASRESGGLGWTHLQKAIAFEEAGYSCLGPIAMNIHAPDEGNIHLLDAVANHEQKQRWLKPMVEGHIRSCFAMTEPAPGAGSDPSMLLTTAVKDGNDYVINGRKWLITGADGAKVAIIMAKMPDGTASMFLTDTDVPGYILEKNMHAMDSCFAGGHGILRFENLRIPAQNILGEVGKGFKYAQVRLAPARLTHCMRWLGQARRAHDTATEYARVRQSFGKRLGDHQGVGFMLADNEIDLLTTRLAVHYCAQVLDAKQRGNYESSLVKVCSADAIWRVIDRSVQVLGGQAMTDECVVSKIFTDARGFRIYDGANEVHRMSISQKLLNQKQ